MIHLNVPQGSNEWLEARLGIPTASNFDKIITATGKPSSSQDKYMWRLLAERLLNRPVDDFNGNEWTIRGTEMEAEAVRWYEFDRDVTVEPVGFCLLDDRSAGCSPDRLVGDAGLLEIKCPSAAVHIGNLLGFSDAHKIQVQGQLYITGRLWCDLLSYNPDLPRALVRVQRDEEFIAALAKQIEAFNGKLRAALGQLREFVEVA